MMYGSVLYNFWAALCSFSVYFVWALQQPFPLPMMTILSSFIIAIIGFLVMYPIRYFLGYIFYTPMPLTYSDLVEEDTSLPSDTSYYDQFSRPNNKDTVEFQDETSEEVAQVVRTMLHKQDDAVSN